MSKVAKMLGLKFNEEFKVSTSDLIFKLINDGLRYRYDHKHSLFAAGAYLIYDQILTGEAEITILPKVCPDCGNRPQIQNKSNVCSVFCETCGRKTRLCIGVNEAVKEWNRGVKIE